MSDPDLTLHILKQLRDDMATFREEVNNRFAVLEQRFDRLEHRVDQLEQRFDQSEQRFDQLEASTTHRFDDLDRNLGVVALTLLRLAGPVEDRITRHEDLMQELRERVARLEAARASTQ